MAQWQMKLTTGSLGGNNVAWVAVDPLSAATRVWLVANNGTLWRLKTDGSVAQVDAPDNLRVVAVLDDINLLALDGGNRLFSRSSDTWVRRDNPGGPSDPFVSVTGDGRGRGWLATRNGRVFRTQDGGAGFDPEPSGFGLGSAPKAIKVSVASEPSEIRWFLDSQRQVWRRGESDQSPQAVQNVATGVVSEMSAGPNGRLWIVQSSSGPDRVWTTDGVISLERIAGSHDVFTVAPTVDGEAWAVKSDGSLWKFGAA
jgi:hypothetical protein